MTMTDSTPQPDPDAPGHVVADYDAVVVGAGFAGLQLLHMLRDRGMAVLGIEAGDGVGGTWYWNRYPGVRCDVQSVDYSFGFHAEVQQEWTWTERYAAGDEIHRYAEFVADRLDLWPLIRFDTRVLAAVFDESRGVWSIETDDGEHITARHAMMATGALSAAKLPDIEGITEFPGDIYHPGRWPQDSPDLSGKRVAVIGTGSSGIQLVTALGPEVEHLYVLQRSPNFSMPARNRALIDGELDEIKRTYPERREESRRTRRGFPVPSTATGRPASDFTSAEQQEILHRAWEHGGAIFTSTFSDLTTDPETNRIAADFVRARIHELVDDPRVAAMLAPTDHPLGGKRPCVDTGYYQTFNRPNVELVDIRQTPIDRVTEQGLQVGTEHLDVDVIILATGYDAITGSLDAIDIRGRGGVTLREVWREGAMAYLGLMVPEFPNMFTITGPGSPSVLANMFMSIDHHVGLTLDLLAEAERRGTGLIEVEHSALQSWGAHVAAIAEGTLMTAGNSWYLGSNIPGKPRQFMPYAGGLVSFIDDCARICAHDFEGFRFSHTAVPTYASAT